MLDKQFWVGKKTPSSEGEGVERTLIREILSAATSSQIPNHETTKKRCDTSKQHSKQA